MSKVQNSIASSYNDRKLAVSLLSPWGGGACAVQYLCASLPKCGSGWAPLPDRDGSTRSTSRSENQFSIYIIAFRCWWIQKCARVSSNEHYTLSLFVFVVCLNVALGAAVHTSVHKHAHLSFRRVVMIRLDRIFAVVSLSMWHDAAPL